MFDTLPVLMRCFAWCCEQGGLLVRGAHGLCVQVVALEHPSVRMAMLLAANHPQRAMNWAKVRPTFIITCM